VPELPGGGIRVLDGKRIVALYGGPQSDELGALGQGSPSEAAKRLREQAAEYEGDGRRPVVPAMELIAVIANAAPGDDGAYNARLDAEKIRDYLEAAREANALLLLDIQPGRSDFLSEVKALREFLEEPNVGVALDPEWSMDSGEVPGEQVGETGAETINEVSDYLADLVREKGLPQKVLLIHRFTEAMIQDESDIVQRPELAIVENADGFGPQAGKLSKYRRFTEERDGLYEGFKLFYKEDTNLMSPSEVLDLSPEPDVVVYE